MGETNKLDLKLLTMSYPLSHLVLSTTYGGGADTVEDMCLR